MNVKQLIEKLSEFDENLPVLVECNEWVGFADKVKLEKKGSETYTKSEHPFDNYKEDIKAVIIY